jgi:hypothetical protein
MPTRHFAALTLALAVALVLGACGGGSYSPPTSPGGPSSGDAAATITIRSDGTVDPKEVRIQVNQRVRFINQDTRQHQPTSNPHLSHTDCPAANLTTLSSGQSQTTAAFTTERACGFHDHLNPDTAGLYGIIRVGAAEGPGGPVYVKQ